MMKPKIPTFFLNVTVLGYDDCVRKCYKRSVLIRTDFQDKPRDVWLAVEVTPSASTAVNANDW